MTRSPEQRKMLIHQTHHQIESRLEELSRLIARYAHTWATTCQKTGSPPARMVRWIDEYDNIKHEAWSVFYSYCRRNNIDTNHCGRDLLA